ncbi:heparinase II/III domain-containing protein [Gracilibacillus timonensis]|uniref:heparinase II/III domain-containing protein n=1 Tax=Gracilibacillus timonensis TaxID=1816696 RepID=UPI0008257328|nr:heparinase II/III family protein [Gracilibacillus timonensis]
MWRKTWILCFGLFVLLNFLPELTSPGVSNHQITAAETAPATEPVIDHNHNRWAVVPEVETEIAIDGDLTEDIWEKAVELEGFVTVFDNEKVEKDTEALLGYDSDNLYVGLTYTDEEASESLANVEILIRPSPDQETFFTITIPVHEPNLPITNDWGPGGEEAADYDYEVITEEGSMTAEVAIPISSLNVDELHVGDEWQLNIIHQHEINTEPMSSWIPIRTSSYNQTDTSTSTSYTIDVSEEGRLGSIFFNQLPEQWSPESYNSIWNPQELKLEYKAFTEKELSFKGAGINPIHDDIALTWRSPSGEQVELDDVNMEKVKDRMVVSFEHPEPHENGLYHLSVSLDQKRNKPEAMFTMLAFDRNQMMDAGEALYDHVPYDGEKTMVEWEPATEEVQQLLDIIPERVGFRFTGLPDQPQLHPDRNFSWDIDQPDIISSNHSDKTYPNEEYPEDQALTVTNKKGKTVEYPYYEDENGRKYFLSAHKWWLQRNYALGQMSKIASEDPLGAARLLQRFAEVYEGYIPVSDHVWQNFPVEVSSGPPYPWWGGVWNRWSASELWDLRNLFNAYATVKQTNALELLSDEAGEDVDQKIVEAMFKPSVEFARTFPIINHNMDYTKWVGLGDMSKAINDPSYIHEGVELLEDYTTNEYLFDGFYKETTLSYHNQSTNGINRAIDAFQGWSDPQGYTSPRSGTRFDDLDMREAFPALGKSQEIPQMLIYPDGKYLPTQDTWANEVSGNPNLTDGSFLLPASGYARLQRGTPDEEEESTGITYLFPGLDIVDQTTEDRLFADSGTVQFEAESEGNQITFVFEVPETDTYRVDLKPFKAASYGLYEILMNNKTITELDFFNTGSGPGDMETLATLELEKGTHEITFKTIGKSDEATNYKMGVIELVLLNEEAQQEDDGEEGNPAQPSQLYMNFDPKYGHNHFDPLNLNLYAKGQELLPDIGYSYTFYRRWATSTMGHNTVVVDSKDMTTSGEAEHGGNIELFAPISDQLQVMRAHQEKAYPGTDEYSREPWFIGFPDGEDGYVLDLFRVSGGNRHEYTLQGDANRDAHFDTDMELTEYGDYLLPEGTEVTLPETAYDTGYAEGHYYGYIYLQNVMEAALEDEQYQLTLTTEENEEEQAKMKITGLLESGENELYLAESPSLRSTRLHGTSMDTNDEAVKYHMPKFVLRRDGENLSSQFITLMEPYQHDEEPRIDHIEKLEIKDAHPGDIAVAVTHGETTDIILSSPHHPEEPLVVDDTTMTGKMGMIRLQNGEVTDMYLIGGSLLEKGTEQLTGNETIKGTLTNVMRQAKQDSYDAFVTDTNIPEDTRGSHMVITHPDGKTHGYEIKEIMKENDQTIIQTNGMDPGFSIHSDGSSEMNFYPFKTWDGEHTFQIETFSTK